MLLSLDDLSSTEYLYKINMERNNNAIVLSLKLMFNNLHFPKGMFDVQLYSVFICVLFLCSYINV